MPYGLEHLLEEYENENLVSIPDDIIRDLALGLTQCDVGVRGVSDWKSVASEFGYSREKITSWESSIRQNVSYSPSEALFNKLLTQMPNLSLMELSQALSDIKNNNAKEVLDKFISNEKRQTKGEKGKPGAWSCCLINF